MSKKKPNLPKVMDFDKAPPQYHVDYHRVRNLVDPFVFTDPDAIQHTGNIYVSCYLWDQFLDFIRLGDIEADSQRKIHIYLMMEIRDRIMNMQDVGDKLTTVHEYLWEMCHYEPLKWPNQKDFDKFKLMEKLK